MGLCFSERFKFSLFLLTAASCFTAISPPSDSTTLWDSPPPLFVQFCLSTSDIRIFERDGTEAEHFTGSAVEILRESAKGERLLGLRILYYVDGSAQTLDRFSLRADRGPILFERDTTAWVRNPVAPTGDWRPIDVQHFPLFLRWNTRKSGNSALLRRATQIAPLLRDLGKLVDDTDATDLSCFSLDEAFERFGITPTLGPPSEALLSL